MFKTLSFVLKACRVLPLWLSLSLLAQCTYQKAELSSELRSELQSFNSQGIPLEDFFKEASYSQLKISPDGRFIAALFPQNGINSLAILSSDLSELVFTGQFDDERHIISYDWVNDKRLVLFAGKKYGYLDGRNSDVRTYFVDYDGKNLKNFFEKEWAWFDLVRILPNDPDHVVMAKYHWGDGGRPTAVKVNVNNGKMKFLAAPPIKQGVFLADEEGEVNVAVEFSEESFDKGEVHYRLGRGTPWKKLDYPAKGAGEAHPFYLDSKEKALYLQSNVETGRSGIYRLDLVSGESKLVSADPLVDLSSVIMDRGQLVGAHYDPAYPEVEIIDPASELMQLYKELLLAFQNQRVEDLHFTRDRSQATFKVSSDQNPGEFYKISVKDKKLYKLGSSRAWLDPQKMAPMKPVEFVAPDGIKVHAYLTLPPTKAPKNLPAVILVHGGPHGVRDYWGFDPEVQFLAARGFAVLQVNYRGSGGYGRPFERSGYKQWGLSMQDDLTDATHWLVQQGYADKRRLAIYGASYGGYAALMGTVREPDLYRCAVSYVGVSDLTIQRHSSDTSQSEAGVDYLDQALGKDATDLKRRSALYNIDKIKVPIFIAVGKDDVRVPYANSERMKDALAAAGKPYEWMARDSEGHGFSQEANRYAFYLKLAQFLEKHTALPQ